MDKRWSKTEIAHLKRHAGSQSLEELAQRFHVDNETVRRKLEELGLLKGGRGAMTGSDDAAIERYEEALRLLYDQKWDDAAKIFALLVDDADHAQISDRSRQFLGICEYRVAEAEAEGDPYLTAVYEKNRGNLATARELCEGLGSDDAEGRNAYLLASIEALAGAEEEALGLLETAIRLDPKNRVHAFHDSDFVSIRSGEGFKGLIAAGS